MSNTNTIKAVAANAGSDNDDCLEGLFENPVSKLLHTYPSITNEIIKNILWVYKSAFMPFLDKETKRIKNSFQEQRYKIQGPIIVKRRRLEIIWCSEWGYSAANCWWFCS